MPNLRAIISVSATICVVCQLIVTLPAAGADTGTSPSSSSPSGAPSLGTVLLPLTPKIDDSAPSSSGNTVLLPLTPKLDPHPAPRKKAIASRPPSTAAAVTSPAPDPTKSSPKAAAEAVGAAPPPDATGVQPDISAENGTDEPDPAASDAAIDSGSVLKGQVQIVADDTEFDQDKNTFLGSGNAIAIIGGQDSKLEADTILYDENDNTIDARGSVKILRNGQVTTGSSFKFKITSDEYLITNADTQLGTTSVVSRNANGSRSGVLFRNGTMTMPEPFRVSNNAAYGPLSSAEHFNDEAAHPDAYVTHHPSYHVTARKMIYERYKDEGNLTVFGGRLVFDNFTLPLPKITASVGSANKRVVFAETPLIGNNMSVGGNNFGPQFNYPVGKTGSFSWAPLIQLGGNTASGTNTIDNTGKIGAGFKAGFTTDTFSAHLAYGTVSNLLVGDLKYRFNKNTSFQSGINRFLNDGMFGARRARLAAELIDNRAIGGIPYLNGINFRTSGGWFQDDPGLLALSGNQYTQLFNQTHTGKVSAYRLEEQITTSTHPIISLGNQKTGVDLQIVGGVAARTYSTGDYFLLGQTGPAITAHGGPFRARLSYLQSATRGQSPFVFDQFIQGAQSLTFMGDMKVTPWLTLGTNLGYNLSTKLFYTKAITAAVGPQDLKVLFSDDFVSGYQRFGFDVLYGQPVKFNKLLVKNGADAGQTGGI